MSKLPEPGRAATEDGADAEEESEEAEEEEALATETLFRQSAATTPAAPRKLSPSLQDSGFVDIVAEIAAIKKSGLNPLLASDDEPEPAPKDQSDSEEEAVAAPAIQPSLAWEKTFYVLVERSPTINEQRARLPIFSEEQHIMEVIRANPVTIICGETGSGKTTQVPQFLYEAGFGDAQSPNPGLIGITQPRRVAATSMAARVGEELGRPSHVSYQVRYDATTISRETRIKFMTDGILLRELTTDFLLTKYSIILLDEAHERNLNTDILIGMLSRIVRLRNQLAQENPQTHRPLRLVIMSATLNIDEFHSPRLFAPLPPLVKVDARQHPVTLHFARRTDPDHVDAAYKIIKKIHANLPPGGILVFLTGKQEISKLAHRLSKRYPSRRGGDHHPSLAWREDEEVAEEEELPPPLHSATSDTSDDEEGSSSLLGRAASDDSDLDDDDSAARDGQEFALKAKTAEPLHVLPLYSLLAPEEQAKVFEVPPEGHRLCVLATNVAETSLTIPNIRYVVDSGLVKQRHFDLVTGAQEYRIEWISKASATQRAGRAGRLGPGHCYRLYSSAVFDQQFPAFSVPEASRTPMEGLVLQLKAMAIDHPERFPMPTPLDPASIMAAQAKLERMGAISGEEDKKKISRLGRKMALFPLAPLWSRLAVMALEMHETPLIALAMVSVMAVGDPFLDAPPPGEPAATSAGSSETFGPLTLLQAKCALAGKPPTSDILVWLNAFLAYRQQPGSAARRSFCHRHCLMPKRMEEMRQQYSLLSRMARPIYPQTRWNEPLPETLIKSRPLRRLIAQSLSDRVAERIKEIPPTLGIKRKALPAYRIVGAAVDDPAGYAYLHPSSILKCTPPPTIVYCELSMTEEASCYVKQVTAIDASWT